MTATDTPTDRVTIRLVYAGRVVGDTTKPDHAWVAAEDPAGPPMRYSKLAATVVGGIYAIESLDAAGSTVYPSTLAYAGEKIDDVDLIAGWEARDRATRDTLNRQAAERRAARDSELDRMLAPLKRAVQSQRTRADAQAVIARVSAELHEAWWTK